MVQVRQVRSETVLGSWVEVGWLPAWPLPSAAECLARIESNVEILTLRFFGNWDGAIA